MLVCCFVVFTAALPLGSLLGPTVALADDDDDDDGVPNIIDATPNVPNIGPAPRIIDRSGDGDVRDSNLDIGDRQTIIECVEEVLLMPAWLRQSCDAKLAAIERRISNAATAPQ